MCAEEIEVSRVHARTLSKQFVKIEKLVTTRDAALDCGMELAN